MSIFLKVSDFRVGGWGGWGGRGGRGGWGGRAGWGGRGGKGGWAGLVEKLTVTPKQNCLKKS